MKKIFIVGDSISIQYGPFLEKYLQGVMEYSRKAGEEEALKNLDIPQGANGGDSSMVLKYLKAKERSGDIDADYLLLNCGLHDIKTVPGSDKKQVSLDQYERNLKEIIKIVSTMKPQLIWITTTPCDEKIHNKDGMNFHRFSADCKAYNQLADAVMLEADIPIIDLGNFTSNLGNDIYCDHVHFHKHIQGKQAAFIAGWLDAK
jgi:lysophospholipase L1-like esterase